MSANSSPPRKSAIVSALVGIALAPCVIADVPRSLCVQGYLENAQTGQPVDGAVNFCVRIYDNAAGGCQVWPVPAQPCTAGACFATAAISTGGVFALTFGDATLDASVFGAAVSQPRWIELSTCDAQGANCITMLPRIELRTTPYAFRAAVADSLSGGGNGGSFGTCTPPVPGEIHMFNGATPLSACVETITLDASAGITAGGQIGIRRGNDLPGVSLQAESEEGAEIHLNSLDGDQTVTIHGGSSSGGGRVALNNGQSGNIETITLDGLGLANAGEITLRNELGNRGLYLRGDIGPTIPGYGGQIGLNKRNGQLSVLMEGSANGTVALYNNTGVNNLLLQGDHGGSGNVGGDGGSIIRMFTGSSPDGSTPDRETVVFDAKSGSGGGRLGLSNGQSLNHETAILDANAAGVGGTIQNGGLLQLFNGQIPNQRTVSISGVGQAGGAQFILSNSTGASTIVIEAESSRMHIARADGSVPIRIQGTSDAPDGHPLICCNGEIRSGSGFTAGGCDVAEVFELGSAECSVPGMVLGLDPQRPGHLKLSATPYDTRVAGIISGANGLQPGVKLGQRADGSDDLPVALSGRVYCYVDATQHAIEIGDMLTTSGTPGHAMKAVDRERAFGAVLGKAMEPLPKGQKGLVLVLVSLQ